MLNASISWIAEHAGKGINSMSVRASIMSFVLKRTIKKQMSNLQDPAAMRGAAGGGMPGSRLPVDIRTETVATESMRGEWVISDDSASDAVMLYLHGGGYIFGSPDSHRDLVWRLAKASGLRVFVLDYRLAPEHPFPAAVDDALVAYQWLLDQGIAAQKIVVAGDSAGGGLATALMVQTKTAGLAMPGQAVLISPWVDLSLSGESMALNAQQDAMLSPQALGKFAAYYLGDEDPKHPLASPLFADLTGLPPTFVMVGSNEVLCSDAQQLVANINMAGGSAEITIWNKMPHVFPLLSAIIPEGKQAIAEIAGFIRLHLDA